MDRPLTNLKQIRNSLSYKEEILDDIECIVVVGEMWALIPEELENPIPEEWYGLPLQLATLRPYLESTDWSIFSGYGGADSYDLQIFTKNRVYYCHEYDGSVCLKSVPRHPPALSPEQEERLAALAAKDEDVLF